MGNAWKNRRRWQTAVKTALAAAVLFVGCKPTVSTNGSADVGNRGRTANAAASEVTATDLTSTTASTVTVTLRSKGGAPILGVTPTISVTPLSALGHDFNFQCGATNAFGVANCSFRSFDAGVAKTVVVTSPVSFSARSAVMVTQAASQFVINTQPTSGTAAGVVNSATLELRDPRNTAVLGDSSTVVTATLVTNTNTNVSGLAPVLQRGVVACSPCTATAAAGQVQFAAGTGFNVNTSGSYALTFSASGLTSLNSSNFDVVGGTPTRTVFTTSPTAAVAPLEIFTQQPIVKVADAVGNIVSTGACATAVLEVSLVGGLGTGTVLGTVAESAVAGVADFSDNALRIDRTVPSSNTYRLSAVDNPVCNGVALTAGQSADITVSDVGIPNKLAFGTQPSSQTTTGTVIPVQPVVRILDSAGNLVTNNNTLEIDLDASGCTANVTIGGDTDRIAVNGLATFNDITLTTASPPRNCQIRATATGVTSVVSSNVRVEATGLIGTKLAWLAQPTATGKNQNILATGPASLTVRVLDSGNNLVAVDNATRVSVVQTPATGSTLSGTVTQQVVNGVATFSDLKLNANGAFNLVASAAGLTSSTSSTFVINNSGVATALKISSDDLLTVNNAVAYPFAGPADGEPDYFPNSITAGVKFERGVIVQVVDENGALVPTASGHQVTLACTSPTTPSQCTLRGFPLTVFSVDGIADFHVGGSHSLRIDTPMGNNIVLSATATGLVTASTPSPIVGSPTTPSSATSSISALCPSAAGVADGVIFVFSKDQFGNAHVGATVTIPTITAGCAAVCGTTDSVGKSSCSFSCAATGTVTVGGTNGVSVTPSGAGATLLSMSASCGF